MIVPATAAWSSDTVELFLLDESDVSNRYVEWLNNPHINRYLESRFEVHNEEGVRDYVRDCRCADNILLFGIRHDDAGHVGNIKLDINARHRIGEVGILIGESGIHGRGIGSEAIRIVARIARDELGLRKLSAGCYESNRGSEKAFVKAGFTVEGHRPAHFLLDDQAESLTLLGFVL